MQIRWFDPEQVARLKEILGDDFDAVYPRLRMAVHLYRERGEGASLEDRMKDASAAARAMATAMKRCVRAVDHVRPYITDAAFAGVLESTLPEADRSDADKAHRPILERLDAIETELQRATELAEEWHKKTTVQGRLRPRQRRLSPRRLELRTSVAAILRAAGIPLSKGSQGVLENVLVIVYDAVGIPLSDLHREAAAAIDHPYLGYIERKPHAPRPVRRRPRK